MKKIMIAIFCSVPFYMNTMDTKDPLITKIKLPSKQEVKAGFKNISLDYFDEKTGLSQTLGDGECTALGVVMAVALAEADFEERCAKMPGCHGTILTTQIHMAISERMLPLLFKDHPECLEAVTAAGLYSPQ